MLNCLTDVSIELSSSVSASRLLPHFANIYLIDPYLDSPNLNARSPGGHFKDRPNIVRSKFSIFMLYDIVLQCANFSQP